MAYKFLQFPHLKGLHVRLSDRSLPPVIVGFGSVPDQCERTILDFGEIFRYGHGGIRAHTAEQMMDLLLGDQAEFATKTELVPAKEKFGVKLIRAGDRIFVTCDSFIGEFDVDVGFWILKAVRDYPVNNFFYSIELPHHDIKLTMRSIHGQGLETTAKEFILKGHAPVLNFGQEVVLAKGSENNNHEDAVKEIYMEVGGNFIFIKTPNRIFSRGTGVEHYKMDKVASVKSPITRRASTSGYAVTYQMKVKPVPGTAWPIRKFSCKTCPGSIEV